MPESRVTIMADRTIAYLDSETGRQTWRTNRTAYNFNRQKNLVAAIQTANPRSRVVRYEDLAEVMRKVSGRVPA